MKRYLLAANAFISALLPAGAQNNVITPGATDLIQLTSPLKGNGSFTYTTPVLLASAFGGGGIPSATCSLSNGLLYNSGQVITCGPNISFLAVGKIGGDTIQNTSDQGQFWVGSNTSLTNGGVFAVSRIISGGSTHAFDDQTFWTPGSGQAYNSFNAGMTMQGDNNISHYNSFQETGTFAGSGTLTQWVGLNTTGVHSGTGIVTNRYHIFMSDIEPSGGGSITTQYGLYMNNFAGATTNYGVYQLGSNVINYFNGQVGINTVTPGASGLNVAVPVTSTSASTGAIRTSGGIGAALDIFTGGRLVMSATAVGGGAGVLRLGGVNFLHGLGTNNVWIGGAGNFSATPGSSNIAIGSGAMSSASETGGSNVALGQNTLNGVTTGTQNAALGMQAGQDNTTGGQNTYVGYNTGRGVTTGAHNTIIGANVTGLPAALANAVDLADGAGTARFDYGVTAAATATITAATTALTGGLSAPALPTSGTPAGSLCVDASGNVFVKTTTGACL